MRASSRTVTQLCSHGKNSIYCIVLRLKKNVICTQSAKLASPSVLMVNWNKISGICFINMYLFSDKKKKKRLGCCTIPFSAFGNRYDLYRARYTIIVLAFLINRNAQENHQKTKFHFSRRVRVAISTLLRAKNSSL